MNHSGTKQLTVFMSESLNHWLNWFVQKYWINSGTNQLECLYEWVTRIIELTDSVQKYWITQDQNQLSVFHWVSHWIIELTDSFKKLLNHSVNWDYIRWQSKNKVKVYYWLITWYWNCSIKTMPCYSINPKNGYIMKWAIFLIKSVETWS